MPQVASPSTKVHAHGHAHARPPRAAQAEGTPSLFDSLVDQSNRPQQQPQDDPAGPAQPAGQKQAAAQATKADTGNDQGAPQPSGDNAAAAATTTVDGLQASDDAIAAAKVAIAAAKDAAKPDESKDAKDTDAKDAAKPDAAADLGQPTPPAPALAAAAAITPPPAPTDEQPQAAAGGDAGPGTGASAPAAAVGTTALAATPAQTGPVEPAFVAAATAQKLQPFDGKTDGKDKAQADKSAGSAGKAAAPTAPQPPAADDQAVPPPPAQADGKPEPDKVAAKPDAQPRHDRADAPAVAKTDAFVPPAPDAGAAAGAQAGLTGTPAAHGASASTGNAASQGASTMQPAITVPVAGLAVEIAGRAHAGNNHFQIRLDPPELGRIEVKLSVDRQGQVTSHLIADRADTLDLLRRDSTGLERALQDAGLKTAGDGLQFSLRDQSFNGRQNGDNRPNASQVVAMDDTLPAVDAATSGYTRFAGRIGGVDIRV